MKMTHISHNFYRISDADAGRLATAAGAKLPRHGYFINVVLPDGRHAELHRTPYRYYTDAPKRGWVWAVMPSRSSTSLSQNPFRLGKTDKAVIRAFTEKRAAQGRHLETDGRRLDGQTGFLRGIAEWKADGKIHFQDLGSKTAQMIQNAIRREAPKFDLAPGWTRGDRSNNPAPEISREQLGRLLNPWGGS